MDALPIFANTKVSAVFGLNTELGLRVLGDKPGLSADTIQKAINEIQPLPKDAKKIHLLGSLLFKIAMLGVAEGVDAKVPVIKIVQLGGDPNIQNKQGVTPLIIASKKGNLTMVEALLNLDDIDLDITDSGGKTAYQYAMDNRDFAKEKSPEQDRYGRIQHMISEKANPLPPSIPNSIYNIPSNHSNLRKRRGGSRKRKSRQNRSRKLRR